MRLRDVSQERGDGGGGERSAPPGNFLGASAARSSSRHQPRVQSADGGGGVRRRQASTRRVRALTLSLCDVLARVQLEGARALELQEGLWQVDVRLGNAGLLPTLNEAARRRRWAPSTRLTQLAQCMPSTRRVTGWVSEPGDGADPAAPAVMVFISCGLGDVCEAV